MEQVEAVAGLAHKHQRTHAQRARQRILSGETENDAAEERHQQAVVNEA